MGPRPAQIELNIVTEFWNQRKSVCLLGLLLCGAFFAILFGGKTLFYRDFGVMAIPATFYHRAAFWNGEIPLWNPYSNCGAPFLAQWGTMCLYPLSLIYLVLPFPWSLNFFCVLHLLIGGWGMYRLCRSLGGEEYPSLLGGTIFVFNGISLSCLSWPNYCVAIGWMPWVIHGVKESLRVGGRSMVTSIIFASLQLLVGVPELVVLTWIFCAGFAIEFIVRKEIPARLVVGRLGAIAAGTSGVIAAQILPFIDLLWHSQRTVGMAAGKWALPLDGWVNLFVPLFRTFKTPQGTYFQDGQQFLSSVYLGVIALFLAGVAAFSIRQARIRWLAIVAILLTLLSLGPNTWIFHVFQSIAPFVAVARYPVKALLALPLVVGLLGAFGWSAWRDFSEKARLRANLAGFVSFALLAIGSLYFMRAYPLPYDRWREVLQNVYARAAFLLLGFGALSWSVSNSRNDVRRTGELLLIAVVFFDAIRAVPNQNPTAPLSIFSEMAWSQGHPGVSAPTLGGGRVFIRPEAEDRLLRSNVADPLVDMLGKRLAEWSHLNLLDLVPKVNGSSTLQLKEQSVVQNLLYSTNQLSPGLLDYLGATLESSSNVVEWQARPSASSLITAGQEVRVLSDSETLTQISGANFGSVPLVFLAAGATALAKSACVITNVSWKPERVSFESSAGEEIIASVAQSYSHNWRAFVDGAETPLLRANYAFQAVVVPAGKHQIEIRYQDRAFWAGCIISLSTIIALVIYSRRAVRIA